MSHKKAEMFIEHKSRFTNCVRNTKNTEFQIPVSPVKLDLALITVYCRY